jgi:hypothetical protein
MGWRKVDWYVGGRWVTRDEGEGGELKRRGPLSVIRLP